MNRKSTRRITRWLAPVLVVAGTLALPSQGTADQGRGQHNKGKKAKVKAEQVVVVRDVDARGRAVRRGHVIQRVVPKPGRQRVVAAPVVVRERAGRVRPQRVVVAPVRQRVVRQPVVVAPVRQRIVRQPVVVTPVRERVVRVPARQQRVLRNGRYVVYDPYVYGNTPYERQISGQVFHIDGFLVDERGDCDLFRSHNRGETYALVNAGGLRQGDHVGVEVRQIGDVGCGYPTLEVVEVRKLWADPGHGITVFDRRVNGPFYNWDDTVAYDRYRDGYYYDDGRYVRMQDRRSVFEKLADIFN